MMPPTMIAGPARGLPLAEAFFEQYPWAMNILVFFLILALIALMLWFVKGQAAGNGFTIHVDEDDITFTGTFPPRMQAPVIEFLRHDVALPGAYRIRGHWEDRRLVIVVQGEQARPMEQRIRNYLKLNLKPP